MKNFLLILCFYSLVLVGTAWAETSAPANKPAQQQTNNGASAKQTKSVKKAEPKVKKVDLKTAYKREFAFLQSQKKELRKRLAEFKAKSRKDVGRQQAKIRGLENETVFLSGKTQELQSQLAESERAIAAMEERSEVLEMTYEQAESSLKNYEIDLSLEQVFQTGTDVFKIELIFNQASELLNKLSSITRREGKFYLNNGKLAEGQIIELGNVAAYGVSDQGSGALVPAGGDQMKMWHELTDDVAQAFINHSELNQLKIFLFESRSKAIEEKVEKTWLSIVNSGGIIGWVIVGLGAFGLILVFIRVFLLKSNSSSSRQIEEQVVNLVSSGDIKAAEAASMNCKGAIARVLTSTLRHVKDDRDHMDDIITEAILHESSILNKFGSTIMVIASVSPLLGLLGTVTGMISTFEIITEFGTGDPKLLSSGISIALVTTELGLIVAIPMLLLGTLLSSWAGEIKLEMEKVALTISNMILSEPEMSKLDPTPLEAA